MAERLRARHPEFAQRVQSHARRARVGVKDIQTELRVTYEMARRYWNGFARPRGARMAKLAALLAVTPAELDYGAAHKTEEAGAAYGVSQEALQIGRAWMRLSPHMRQLYRETLFRDAAVEHVLPWLKPTLTKPVSANYDTFEHSIERDYQEHIRQLKLDI